MLFALMLAFGLDLDLAKIVPEAMAAAEVHKHEVLNTVKRCPVVAQQEHTKVLSSEDNHEIVVFVSGSMPKATLKAFKNTNTRLVIRGLINGSIQETASLVKDIGVALDIDPVFFERLNVNSVPVFAVQKGDDWHILKGNVTVGYAMEQLK